MLVEFPKAKMCNDCEIASHGIYGGAMTYAKCKGCGDTICSGNTFIDKYCVLCAIDFNICPHCGEEHKN